MKWQSSLIRYRHRQCGSTAYRLQARPALTGPGLRVTAMPRPGLKFNGRHPRDPFMDGRLSWPIIVNWPNFTLFNNVKANRDQNCYKKVTKKITLGGITQCPIKYTTDCAQAFSI